ncbi:endonuclease/exonuclease/phosphatase family protein [Membranihabitans marinus]|uniref:endonuclease/exonuclease/phosphatase family protein n=1 Tax=Membranihabitans marinus TaxID=1227546 RepID=UPI001F19E51B|nr:endonuclease/exonuclease/phosphatase family protein [Membranihabitans marinus]
MTYNIRYANEKDGPDRWDERKESLVKEILFYEPDFLGVQEAVHEQVLYLDQALKKYKYIGVARNDGQTEGEYSAIFYHTERVKNIEASTFWLSDSPDIPSVGWDASLKRICTYGKFKYLKSKKDQIYVFNTHFDHRGIKARENSADLILKMIEEKTGNQEAVILMGDLNLTPDTAPIKMFSAAMQDSYTAYDEIPFGPTTTYTGFKITENPKKRIDYIFGNNKVKFEKTAVLSHWIDMHFNSDHFPIFAQFSIKK